MINLFKKPYKKKAGKFQPFKKLFGRRKKREPVLDCEEAKLKPSHSFGNICNSSSSDEETTCGVRLSQYSMGSRAFSHDSIFIPDGRTESEPAVQAMSQENVLGKVKTLQQQLAKNIKFGQPPQMTISARTMGEANASLEEDVLLSSPVETETQQDTVISESSNKFTDSPHFWRTMTLPEMGYEAEEKVAPLKSSRPKRQFSCSGTIETINLDAVPQAVARLDNSAAKHKLAVKPKKQRVSRKHKRLTKGSQSLTITEFEPDDLEPELYGDRYPGYNGHITMDKLIQNREEEKQLQLAEEKSIEDHWGILEAERIRQIVEMEEQRDMEEQRCQELEQMQKEQERKLCEEQSRQQLLEGETSLKTEKQTCQKEERRLLEAAKRQELEEQRGQEQDKQQRQELENQKLQQREEQSRQELEEQKLQEREQQRQKLEDQKLQEQKEQQRQELEEQKLQELEEQKLQEQKEQQRKELEKQRPQEQEKQQRPELGKQRPHEQKQQRPELKKQWSQEEDEQQIQELEQQRPQEHKQQRPELKKQWSQEEEEQQIQELEKQGPQEQKQQRPELEKQRHQEMEEQQRQKLEEQKLQEREEQQRPELEEQNLQEREGQRCQELEKQHQEWEEQQQRKEQEEKQRQELEKQKRLELQELRQNETEKQHQEGEERNLLKEQKKLKKQNKEENQRQELEELQDAERKPKQEKEAEHLKQEKKQEEQRQHLKEKEEKTEREQPQQVMDKRKKREDQRKHKLTKQMHMVSGDGLLQDGAKQEKERPEREGNKLEEQKADAGGQNPQQGKCSEQQQAKEELCPGRADRHPAEEKLQEGSRSQKPKQPEKGSKTAEEVLAQKLKREVEAQEQKRIGEELRWQEVDERQTASRPFTFQVSSGDKQIIFQKVNLSPVMPLKGAGQSSPPSRDCGTHAAGKVLHTLPSSACVPHTAILVTGAQLCGTAVNLNQIKDTACKSLLGLTEERRTVEIPSPEKAQKKKQDPKPSSSKMKYAQESLNSQAVLAEWASIRSRILKNAESGTYERDRESVCRHSDDWTPRGRGAPHGNLRKTLSANAKFSITPAWQKFSDASRTGSDAENVSAAKGNEAAAAEATTRPSPDLKEGVASTSKDTLAEKAKEKTETPSETTDNTEGCKFAKDLPSFLVPSSPRSPGKELPQAAPASAPESQPSDGAKTAEKAAPNGEENASPFGIKLRRTNYSLRFHYDQQAEQRKKKRYSAGDSFEGVPDPLVTTEGDKDSSVFAPQESTSPGVGRANIPTHLKDSKDSSVPGVETPQPAGVPVATSQSALPHHEKPTCKSQKPALAPKPTSQTPPPSPLFKINRQTLADALAQRMAKAESDGGWRKDDRANVGQPAPATENKTEEEEIREKKSFFPSISIPWREKNDKKPEPPKKEKPVLQSRHSLDGSKLMEKVETSQPLWITLALQKQKGFREQQATREERRQAREAKQAEKLAKEIAAVSNQPDSKSSSSSSKTSTLQKSTTQEGEKKAETAVSRLERREQLKKSNTLPTSVTVEISDSVPSTPLAKEVAKRFSTPDANPVSTEPAWLALAKRKAKAWSDCPQIIK